MSKEDVLFRSFPFCLVVVAYVLHPRNLTKFATPVVSCDTAHVLYGT